MGKNCVSVQGFVSVCYSANFYSMSVSQRNSNALPTVFIYEHPSILIILSLSYSVLILSHIPLSFVPLVVLISLGRQQVVCGVGSAYVCVMEGIDF